LALASLPSALAQLGRFLPLPEHAGFFEETATASFGQNSISLDLPLEALQGALEGLTFLDYYSRHMFPPLLH
jgi:hypothetical protein